MCGKGEKKRTCGCPEARSGRCDQGRGVSDLVEGAANLLQLCLTPRLRDAFVWGVGPADSLI